MARVVKTVSLNDDIVPKIIKALNSLAICFFFIINPPLVINVFIILFMNQLSFV